MTDGRRLEKEIVLDATPGQVWEAIATGPGLAGWFAPMEIEPRQGGISPFGTITAWEPGKRLEVQGPPAENGSTDTFEFLVQPRGGGGTVLRFTHIGFLGDNWETEYEAEIRGWDMYFHTLAQYLEYFAGRNVTFVDAEAPQESAAPSAWAALRAGLGLADDAAEGDEVRLRLDGLEPIEGVLDYVRPNYLGIRTAGGLYRFHGRAALGLPIAVGHHLYTDQVDRVAARKAWQTWLEGLFPASA